MRKKQKKMLNAILAGVPWLILLLLVIGLSNTSALLAQISGNASTENLKTEASKYLQNSEKTADPVSMKFSGYFYNYVPFEINSTIGSDFPGIVLDWKGNAVTDKTLLKNLFKYAGVLKRFTYNVKEFDKLALKKVSALNKYCQVLKVQEIRFNEIYAQGHIVGFIYQGVKLAADAASAIQAGVKSIATLAKDLAKSKIQDTILSYLTEADSNAILESADKAYYSSKQATAACNKAKDAWKSLVSTSGSLTPEKAESATADARIAYQYEAKSISELQAALQRVNNYPKLVTKISKAKFTKGTKDLVTLADKLRREEEFWKQENEQANFFLEDWADEQISRINAVSPVAEELEETPEEPVDSEEPVEPDTSLSGACSAVDLSANSTLYTYTTACTEYQTNISSSSLALKCKSSAPSWRNHWVKEINVSGYSKLKLTADIGLKDYARFFIESGGVGVKYDDYSDIAVLSADPRPVFDAECNKTVSQADWPKCGLAVTSGSVLGHCGVPKYTESAHCDFEVNTTGLEKVYLLYQIHDAWLADVEGSMANVETCLSR